MRLIPVILASVMMTMALASTAHAQRNFYNRGVALYNPIVDTVFSGSSLVVQPTVSTDRKYVTMAMAPQLSQVVRIESFPFFGVGVGAAAAANPGKGSPGQWPADATVSRPTVVLPAPQTGLLSQAGMTYVSPP